jgi:hypothetical protein
MLPVGLLGHAEHPGRVQNGYAYNKERSQSPAKKCSDFSAAIWLYFSFR